MLTLSTEEGAVVNQRDEIHEVDDYNGQPAVKRPPEILRRVEKNIPHTPEEKERSRYRAHALDFFVLQNALNVQADEHRCGQFEQSVN